MRWYWYVAAVSDGMPREISDKLRMHRCFLRYRCHISIHTAAICLSFIFDIISLLDISLQYSLNNFNLHTFLIVKFFSLALFLYDTWLDKNVITLQNVSLTSIIFEENKMWLKSFDNVFIFLRERKNKVPVLL